MDSNLGMEEEDVPTLQFDSRLSEERGIQILHQLYVRAFIPNSTRTSFL